MDGVVRRIPIVRTCCCGCTLYNGTMIITILDLLSAIGQFLSACVVAGALQEAKDAQGVDDKYDGLIDGLYGLMVFFALYYLFITIVASMAIHGARTRQPRMMLPWLIALVFRELIALVVSIVMLAEAASYAEALSKWHGSIPGSDDDYVLDYSTSVSEASIISQAIWILICVGLNVYFFLVVYSFYLEAGNPPPQPQHQGVFVGGSNPTIVVPPGSNVIYAGQQPNNPHQQVPSTGGVPGVMAFNPTATQIQPGGYYPQQHQQSGASAMPQQLQAGAMLAPTDPYGQGQQPPPYGKLSIN